jgi:predicted MPP superfamily phosphohydrolase
VRRVNAIAADLVAITGDLVDGPIAIFGSRIEPLADLRSTHGTFFVTGNHEYYSGVDHWLPRFRSHGLRVLRNERVAIEHKGAIFDLAGIDDHESKRWGGDHGPDLERALAGRDETRPVVLMAHQPRQVRVAARHKVDLQLSGHTHGGQIWPWHGIARMQQGGLLAGLYKFGETQLYVSRGTGYVGPPVRIGAPAEITRITLRAA